MCDGAIRYDLASAEKGIPNFFFAPLVDEKIAKVPYRLQDSREVQVVGQLMHTVSRNLDDLRHVFRSSQNGIDVRSSSWPTPKYDAKFLYAPIDWFAQFPSRGADLKENTRDHLFYHAYGLVTRFGWSRHNLHIIPKEKWKNQGRFQTRIVATTPYEAMSWNVRSSLPHMENRSVNPGSEAGLQLGYNYVCTSCQMRAFP